jgi:phosphopantetheine--protein transferase-like protein
LYGLGIDIEDIEQFETYLLTTPALLGKLFTIEEIGLELRQLAGNFAAKEALFKALLDQTKFQYTDLYVIRCETGKPAFIFKNDLQRQLTDYSVHLSLSNKNALVVACVVIS